MYRLLIVDDEPIIANALYEVFQDLRHLDLDVCKAYSGNAALEWLNNNKIDIVLSDIRMPGIDGIQLLEYIRAKWPQCRVILLTGYNEFDYVYKAIQFEGVSYLLKTEGYDKVIKAVEDVVADIDKSLKMEDILYKANEQITLTHALLQKEYFMALLKSETETDGANYEQFMQLGIPLNSKMPLLILMGRVDNFLEGISYLEKSKNILSVELIAEQYFSPLTVNIGIVDEHTDMIWFLQPKELTQENALNHCEEHVWEQVTVFIKGMLETIQASCNKSLKLSVSFVLSSQPISWNECAKKYTLLKQLLDYRIGSGTEMLLIDQFPYSNANEIEKLRKVQQLQTSLKKIGILNMYLERGQRKEFFEILHELTAPLEEISSMYYNSALEIYYSISLMFLSYINRWNITEEIIFSIGLSKLTHIDQYDSWKDSINYFVKLAEIIFGIQDNEQEKRAGDAIARIEKYIEDNVRYELSLVKLAELVHFNASYLSRLFKQVKGETLSDYILNVKIKKAKQLLEQPTIKVHEVAEAVGYNTAQNFTRFFKKNTGTTPQEYRDFYLTGKQVR